jgi:hypothetical protein
LSTTGDQDSPDDLGVGCGKGLLERLLVLGLGAQRTGRLGRSILIFDFDEADLLRSGTFERATLVVVVVIKVELACGCWRLAACFLLASCVSLCRREVPIALTGLSECEPSDMLVMLLLCYRRQVHVWAVKPRGTLETQLVDPVSGQPGAHHRGEHHVIHRDITPSKVMIR